MAKMRGVQVSRAGGPLEIVERAIPEPGSGWVRIKVQACGVCHSDVVTKDGLWPGLQYPRVPGHEAIGVIDAVGSNVPPRWKAGQRVGVGWNGGYCGYCDHCRRGDFFTCQTSSDVTGVTRDGGYAEYMLAPTSALALVPNELCPVDAAPLMCAGVTTFNCLRNSGARPGDLVAVLGIGGLGHLAVQYAKAAGFETIAISHSPDKDKMIRDLGADEIVRDGKTLAAAGGADVILSTSNSTKSMVDSIQGLRPDGRLVTMGADGEPLSISLRDLIMKRIRVIGSQQNGPEYLYEALDFVAQGKVKTIVETYPLAEAPKAYQRVVEGKARFRAVLTM
jgi:D-arabinose 1-dehydrogenase-like Zn-dependent alcohol dehydrogenase